MWQTGLQSSFCRLELGVLRGQDNLQKLTDQASKQSGWVGLVINSNITEVMSNELQDLQVTVHANQLEQVENIIFLEGQITNYGRCEADVKRLIVADIECLTICHTYGPA
jgi:hypothetical protein